MTIELTEHENIKFFNFEGNKYITIADLERLTGLNAKTTTQWKNRNKIVEGIDYYVMENPHLILININSEYINKQLMKRNIKPLN